MLPGDGKHVKTNIGELKSKLMVDFDPVRCFVNDIEASSSTDDISLNP